MPSLIRFKLPIFGRCSVALAALILSSGLVLARPSAVGGQQQPLVELDFELVGGRIYVPITINGNRGTAVLDTGAGASVMDIGLANKWDLKSSGGLTVGGAGDKMVSGKVLSSVSAKLGAISVPIQFAIPIAGLSKMEGRPLETIIGYGFFNSHIVQVDYENKHIKIFGKDLEAPALGTEVPIRIEGGLIRIKSKMHFSDRDIELETMIDTGASEAALTTHFLKGHPVKEKATQEAIVGGGVGGTTKGRLFRPESVSVGGTTFSNPLVSMVTANGGIIGDNSDFDFLLGAVFLKRFVVTFDYPHQRLFLLPNSTAGLPFEADKMGHMIPKE